MDHNEYTTFGQAVTAVGSHVITTYLGTTMSSGLDCCHCGWVLRSAQQDTMATPSVMWSGTGRPTAVATDDGTFLATVDINNDELLILSL